ncbi:molybdopterin-dependent oxidoreductase [Candidatus Fermentibacteria bacterium]|nr:molybdopterin-dependent oxidoreductase [Candidatus Fermentibacteria bacterium]
MVTLTINGKTVEASPEKTILEVVQENRLDEIPTLCHSFELTPYGSCFVCVVELAGRPNLVPACATRVAEGMEVRTRSERVMTARKTALELLCSNHYADCVSPCMEGCPAGVDVQGYLALSAMGQYREAVNLIRKTNPLPAICGRVCVRKCEVECRRQDVDQPVAINAVKRFLTDVPGIYDSDPQREPGRGMSVGIVGGGPAGLTVAWFLGLNGYDPVIYEANEKAGGMLRYGIPGYRLPDEVLDAEIEYIQRAGAEIRTGIRVGEDVTLEELRERHDAVFLGPGAWAGKSMRVEGEYETEGVVMGADFLNRMAVSPEKLRGTVVVVGGGNTAMDVARTAWRLDAEKVIIAYRRTKAQMPADEMEIEDCLEEGIEVMELTQPVGIVKDDQGKIKALKCIRMKLGEPDASGRKRPVPIEGSDFQLPCDLAVSAIGQKPILDGLDLDGRIEVSRWSTYQVDTKTMQTTMEGVFAGGDAADDGPTVVIDAIRDGQRAASAIHAHLSDRDLQPEPFVVRKEFWTKPGKQELGEIEERPRHEVHTIDVEDRRSNFREVATGFEYEDNVHETDRCLACGCLRYDDCKLRLYAEEYGVDMEHYKGYVRKHRVDDRHPYIAYDPNKCILCSRCIRTCERVLPISALGLVNRGFRTEMRPAMNDPLVDTNCISCGNCVDSCPTGALTFKYPFRGRAALETEEVETHCAFCSLGCRMVVRKFADARYYIRSAEEPGEYLCRYGRFGNELFIRRSRLTSPLIRAGLTTKRTSMEEACERVFGRMREVAEAEGPSAVGVFVSPELSNEQLYLACRIAREGLGTNNVGSMAILGNGNESGELDSSLGFTASTTDRSVLSKADLIICNNTSLEDDHLILAVDLIEAVRSGTRFVVSNSILDPADRKLATLTMDPMRGRGALLWNGVIQLLLDEGFFPDVRSMPGGEEFLRSREGYAPVDVARAAGVPEESLREAAELVRNASNVVFVHSPDRPQDQAPGDLQTLANFLVLLRSVERNAHLLLPRLIGNSAGLEVCGTDPVFCAGRMKSQIDGGASSREELRKLLTNADIRAALVVGENPMAHNLTASYLQNVEFMAAMDWTDTETVNFADVALPGCTFLEERGTRCNFEGKLLEYREAVRPPSGVPGWKVLLQLARTFGIDVDANDFDQLSSLVDDQVRQRMDQRLLPFYWNTGQERRLPEELKLVPVSAEAEATPIHPPLTHGEEYKSKIREVGTERFRVK